MGDVEDRGAELALDALQLDPQVLAQLGIERRQRLVHQETVAGSRTSARPIATRCISPPDSLVARCRACPRSAAVCRDLVDPCRDLGSAQSCAAASATGRRDCRRRYSADRASIVGTRRRHRGRAGGSARHVLAARSGHGRRPGSRGRRPGAASWSCRRRSARAARRTRRRRSSSRGRATATVSPKRLVTPARAGSQPWPAAGHQSTRQRAAALRDRTARRSRIEREADPLADRQPACCSARARAAGRPGCRR